MALLPVNTAIAKWNLRGVSPTPETPTVSCRVIVLWPPNGDTPGSDGVFECMADLVPDRYSPDGYLFRYFLWDDEHQCQANSPELVAWRSSTPEDLT